MSIKLTVSDQDKAIMANLAMESQVLNNLLIERRTALEKKGEEVLTTNALSPKRYSLKFNPTRDLWEAEPRQGQIIVPSQKIAQSKN